MPRVRIKQLDTRTATAGIHMGGGVERRKLHPGEVVDIPEDFEAGMYKGKSLFHALWDTGKLELTMDPATRPIDFEDYRQAQLTEPTFKVRGPDEVIEVEQAFEAVASNLAKSSVAPVTTGSPANDKPAPAVDSGPSEDTPVTGTTNRRADRRAALRAAKHEQKATA